MSSALTVTAAAWLRQATLPEEDVDLAAPGVPCAAFDGCGSILGVRWASTHSCLRVPPAASSAAPCPLLLLLLWRDLAGADRVERLLALGASRSEASRELLSRTVRLAMTAAAEPR